MNVRERARAITNLLAWGVGIPLLGPVLFAPPTALVATGTDDFLFVFGIFTQLPLEILGLGSSHTDAYVAAAPFSLLLVPLAMLLASRLPRTGSKIGLSILAAYSLIVGALGLLCILGQHY